MAALLAPGATEEFERAALADVQAALGAVDENAFPTLLRKETRLVNGVEKKVEKRIRPDNCRAWKVLKNRGFSPRKLALSEQVDAGALVRCGALEFLARARPARLSFVPHNLAGAGPESLPAIVATATSKLAQRSRSVAASRGLSLAEYLPAARAGQAELPGRVLITEPASATSVIVNVEAWGDINSDEVEDLLLSVLNAADDGTYFDMRLIEVTRATVNAPLTVLGASR